MIEFAAALLGALVGGLASLMGSIVVERLRLLRNARFRIFDDYVPAIEGYWDAMYAGTANYNDKEAAEAVRGILRLAAVSGRKERQHAFSLYTAWTARSALFEGRYRLDAGGSFDIPDDEERRRRLKSLKKTSVVSSTGCTIALRGS